MICKSFHKKPIEHFTDHTYSRPNHEKVLYTKLLRFREEQLENYEGPPMDYSMSDYHHNPPQAPPPPPVPRRSSTRASLQASRANGRQSQYSLLDSNMPPPRNSMSQSIQRRSSVAKTEESYDPYRPSRTQIAKTPADHMRVTVLRGVSQQTSRKSSTRVPSKASSRGNTSINRAQNANDVYSIASSPPSTKMHSAGTSQLQRLKVDRGISRGSSRLTMASRRSTVSASSAIVTRKSTSYKRNVSFVHNRKRSFSGRHPRLRSQEDRPSPFTLQERFYRDQAHAQPQDPLQGQAEDKALPTSPAVSRFSLRETPDPEDMPVVRSRKDPIENLDQPAMKQPRTRSNHFKDDARKVSTEIEKLCDEAFNRPSLCSNITTPRTTDTGNRDSTNTYQTVQSSTTSFSVHEDPVPVSVTRHNKAREITLSYQQRPLPKPPATERQMDSERLGSYTQRELAKTRDLLKKRAAESDMSPGYLDEVIAHLDRLMQPSAIRINDEERRAISTPDPNSGIQRIDTFEQIMEKANVGYRSASEPTARHRPARGATIRLVGSPSGLKPVSPVKPLTIRKKSQSSTPSGGGSPRQITPTERLVTTEELYRQAEERRSAGLASLNNPSLGPIEEDEDKENFDPANRNRKAYLGESKKRGWFRRQPLPPIEETRTAPDSDTVQDPSTVKRKSGTLSDESQISEPKRSGRGLLKKIFAGKRGNKNSQLNFGGDYDLDDGNSIATEEDTWVYNPAQAFMSGGLQDSSHASFVNGGSKGSRDEKLMPPSIVPRIIQPQHQNWLARFLRIKPAVDVMCFQVSKVKARKEVANVFREWRKYGMRDIVVDKAAGRIWARVDVKNCTLPSPFALVCATIGRTHS